MSSPNYRLIQRGNITVVGNGDSGGKGTNTCLAASQLEDFRKRTGTRVARIPKTTVLTDQVASKIREDEQGAKELIRILAERRRLVREHMAVRSSAICEDGAYSCPGLFGTELLAFKPRPDHHPVDLGTVDMVRILDAIVRVNKSSGEPRASEFVARRRLDARMAVMLQTLVGGTINNGKYFAPVFAGVVDTSGINGEGTTTVSMVLGLGGSAISSMHNSTTLIVGKNDFEVVSKQGHAEVLKVTDHATTPTELLSMQKILRYLGFASLPKAIEYFVTHHLGPLKTLVDILDKDNPLDLEFAITPSHHRFRLYYLQSRRSHFVRLRNPDYPTEIPPARTIASSLRVIGGTTVQTKLLAVYPGSSEYSSDTQSHFAALKELDALGEPYILIVPPDATSSVCKNLPITTLTNLVFVIEDPDLSAVHDRGITGVDHFTRLFFDTGIPYMEARIDLDVLDTCASSKSNVQGGKIDIYRGDFVGAVCSSSITGKKGVLFVK